MARLPIPGSDDGSWGDILNQYMLVSHNPDGTLRSGQVSTVNLSNLSVTSGKLADGSVSEIKLDDVVRAKLNEAAPVSSVAGKVGDVSLDKSDVGLSSVDNTSDVNKPVSTAVQAALNTKADDAGVVHLAGSETIAGDKDFTGALTNGGVAVVVSDDARLADQRVPQDGSVATAKLQDGAVAEAKLDSAVQAKLNAVPPVTSVSGRTGDVVLSNADVGLPDVENVKVLTVPVGTAVPPGTPDGTLFVEYTP